MKKKTRARRQTAFHRILLPDGSCVCETTRAILDRVIAAGAGSITDRALYWRLRKWEISNNDPMPLESLLKPLCTRSDSGAIGGNVGQKRSWTGVEGYPEPVTCRTLWNTWIRDVGNVRPQYKTLQRRLEKGIRSKAELTVDQRLPSTRPNRVIEAHHRSSTPEKSTTAEVPKKGFLGPKRSPLPDINEWEGWDKRYYRRVPL